MFRNFFQKKKRSPEEIYADLKRLMKEDLEAQGLSQESVLSRVEDTEPSVEVPVMLLFNADVIDESDMDFIPGLFPNIHAVAFRPSKAPLRGLEDPESSYSQLIEMFPLQ